MTVFEMEKLRKMRVPTDMKELYQKLLDLGYENLEKGQVLNELIYVRGIDIGKELGIGEDKVQDMLNGKIGRIMAKRLSKLFDVPHQVFRNE